MLEATAIRGGRRLLHRHPGRRLEAVGLQGLAALHVRQGREGRDTTGDGEGKLRHVVKG
jgi:hypothetical protein